MSDDLDEAEWKKLKNLTAINAGDCVGKIMGVVAAVVAASFFGLVFGMVVGWTLAVIIDLLK